MKEKDEKGRLERLQEITRNAPLEGPPVLRWVRRAPQGIKQPGKGLGVFPSSFNPPTTAHRILIERARRFESLDEVLLVLDRKPLNKEIFGASLEERLAMILLFCQKDPTVSVAFTNRGRFVEKLALLLKAYPPRTTIRFIVGYDTLIRVLDSKYYDNRDTSLKVLFSGCEFLVATRGPTGIKRIREFIHRPENRSFSKRIKPFTIPFPIRQISSTHVRDAIRIEQEIAEIVPPEIASYIERKGLYGESR